MELITKLVDIIVPIYNQALCINRCINSIIKQTYNNWHLILIDDGSTDDSIEICEKYAGNDSRITVIKKVNGGVAIARNEGLKYLSGTFTIFIDSDDYIEIDYIETLVSSSCDYDMIVSGNIWVDKHEDIIKENIPDFYKSKDLNDYIEHIHNKESFKYFTSPWGKLFRTAIIKNFKLQFRNIEYGEDTCFVFDYLYRSTSIKMLNEAKYYYYISENSLSRKKIDFIWKKLKDINNYCRKDFYALYDQTWNYMYLRIIKVALGNCSSDYDYFKKQFKEIRNDKERKYLRISLCNEMSDKFIYVFIKMNLKLTCFMAFRAT